MMQKRYRKPKAKDGQLLVKYGQEDGERDLFYCWPDNDSGMKRDVRLLMLALERNEVWDGKSVRQELEDRGYDITTLKFTISKKSDK